MNKLHRHGSVLLAIIVMAFIIACLPDHPKSSELTSQQKNTARSATHSIALFEINNGQMEYLERVGKCKILRVVSP